MIFTGKSAVVTGGASGIGRACCIALAAAGARVFVTDINEAAGIETASIIGAADHGTAEFVPVDVCDPVSVTALAEAVHALVPHVDIVVNGAGWDRIEPFLQNTADYWEKIVALNFLGTVRVTRAFLDPMIASGEGRVVNIASDAGRVGSTGETVYAGAKGGVIAFSKSLAREMARHRVTVNCVCPGPTDTPLFRAQPPNLQELLLKAIPLRRLGTPEDVAHAALFFASPQAGYVTGQVLSVSGGLTMAG